MAHSEFLVPSDDEWLDGFGVTSAPVEDEETTREVRVALTDDTVVTISYDVVGRSVRFTWGTGASSVIDLYREGATRLSLEDRSGATFVIAEFGLDSLHGTLEFQVFPDVKLTDRLLIS